MIIVQSNEVIGLIAPINQEETALLPLKHDCGVSLWICTNADGQYAFSELNGITRRTAAEIELMSEWIAWNRQQEIGADAANAHALYQTMPNWLKTFTTEDIEAYVETNVTNLATIKIALTHLGKAHVIFRDFLRLKQ